MIRKGFLGIFMLCCFAMATIAQSGEIKGVVKLQNADKTETPIANAEVTAYRIDADSGKLDTVMTNEKGEFVLTGAKSGHVYAVTASAAGADARLYPEAKSGDTNVAMVLPVGSGSKLDEEEIRATAKEANRLKKLSPEEQKKAEEERKKLVAEIEAKNKKVVENNATVNKLLAEGNKLFESKKFSEAIVKYDEGYTLQPDFIGSAPVFLNNKGVALRQMVVDEYNAAVKNSDAAAKAAGINKVKQYLADSLKSTKTSYELLAKAQPSEVTNKVKFDQDKYDALFGITDTYRLMNATKNFEDPADAVALFDAYFEVEKEADKKAKSQAILGEMLLSSGNTKGAIDAYRKALTASGNNPDALAGLGLALYSMAAETNDKAMYQDSADHLKKFADVAPANHPYKDDADALLKVLKDENKITPKKLK